MKYLYLFLLIFLVGCTKIVKETELVPIFAPVTCANIAELMPIKTLPVDFVLGKDTEGYAILGLRGDQYTNLAINSAETLRYIKEQKILSSYYLGCIEHHNSLQNEKGPPE